MKIDARPLANWLVSTAVLLGLLVAGQPLLVPFLFAVLLWSVFHALTDWLRRVGLPRWLSAASSLALIAAALYLIARILGDEASAIASRGPAYIAKLEALANSWLAFLRLGPAANLADIVTRQDVAGLVGQTAVSLGGLVFELILIVIYVGFLISEQRYLPAKLLKLTRDGTSREEGRAVIDTIARQIQTYLGVCTLLSAAMAAVTYFLLAFLNVDFAGFWALVMFLLTYIPTVGAFGVLLPALMALVQFGSFGTFVIVGLSLGAVHFVLTNIVQAVLLGRSLNLSPLAIILSLSFWGLVWGIAGLFLAVPVTAAIAIVCEHIDGVHWVSVALAGPSPRRARAHPS